MSRKYPKTMHEIFQMVEVASSREEKANVLKMYKTQALLDVLAGAFDDRIQWDLPKGNPPYKKPPESDEGHYPSNLFRMARTLKHLVKHPSNANIKRWQKERVYTKILESIDPKDGNIVLWMKDKELTGKYKGLTKHIVQMAFPDLIPVESEVVVEETKEKTPYVNAEEPPSDS